MTTVLSKKAYMIIENWLVDQGVAFDCKANDYAQLLNDLDREGATDLKLRNAKEHFRNFENYADAAAIILCKFEREFEVRKRNDKRV